MAKRDNDDGEKSGGYLKDRMNRKLFYLMIFLGLVIVSFTIFHVVIVQAWKGKFFEASDTLNQTREELVTCRIKHSLLSEDVQRYDNLYNQQRVELEHSKEMTLLELYYESGAETNCVPKMEQDMGVVANLVIAAKATQADGWPAVHIFVNGKHSNTIEVNSDAVKKYSTAVEMGEDTNHIDIIYTDHFIDVQSRNERTVTIESITLEGNSIRQADTIFDRGGDLRMFDCKEENSGKWTFDGNGALRFAIT